MRMGRKSLSRRSDWFLSSWKTPPHSGVFYFSTQRPLAPLRGYLSALQLASTPRIPPSAERRRSRVFALPLLAGAGPRPARGDVHDQLGRLGIVPWGVCEGSALPVPLHYNSER